MTDTSGDEGWLYRWTLSGSLAVHALAAFLLIFGLPVSLPESEQPPAINVDLVPQPEPREEAKPEPPAPEPPAPEQPEEAEAAPPPPPPPPPPDEAAERPPEMPVLDPVYQYGEKDAGPADATDGNAAQDSPPEPEVAEEQPPETPQVTPDVEAQTAQAEAQEKPPTEPAQDIASEAQPAAPDIAEAAREGSRAPQVLSNPGQPDLADLPAAAQTEPVEDLPAVVAELPAPRPAPPRRAEAAPDLQRAQRIFSRPAVVNSQATVAMGNMPRGVRAGRLCVTELREQLLNGVPPYYPDLLPNLRLEGEGRVLNEPRTEFRMAGNWYNLSVRCTVDSDATRVTAFAFRVGGAIPHGEWAARRLPVW